MSKGIRVFAQVLTAVGVTLAAGGIASYFWENVELRFFNSIVSSDRSRLVWILSTLLLAVVGVMMLRSSKNTRRP